MDYGNSAQIPTYSHSRHTLRARREREYPRDFCAALVEKCPRRRRIFALSRNEPVAEVYDGALTYIVGSRACAHTAEE